jgi:hypothetical protein
MNHSKMKFCTKPGKLNDLKASTCHLFSTAEGVAGRKVAKKQTSENNNVQQWRLWEEHLIELTA